MPIKQEHKVVSGSDQTGIRTDKVVNSAAAPSSKRGAPGAGLASATRSAPKAQYTKRGKRILHGNPAYRPVSNATEGLARKATSKTPAKQQTQDTRPVAAGVLSPHLDLPESVTDALVGETTHLPGPAAEGEFSAPSVASNSLASGVGPAPVDAGAVSEVGTVPAPLLVQRLPRAPGESGAPRITITDAGLSAIEQASAEGATLGDVARRLGISLTALKHLRQDEATNVQLAIDKGLARLETEFVSLLIKAARSGNMTAILFTLKGKFGWRDQGPTDGDERKAPNVSIYLPGALSPEEYMAKIKVDVNKIIEDAQ